MENIGKTLPIHFVICLTSSVLLTRQQSSLTCYLHECRVVLKEYIKTVKFTGYKVYLMSIQNVHSLSLYKTKLWETLSAYIAEFFACTAIVYFRH